MFLWEVLAAFWTSAFSAIMGMGGGIVLLSVMLLTMDFMVVIPVHGCIQLFSNLSRTVLFRRDVAWGVLLRYSVGLVPCSLAAIFLVGRVEAGWLPLLVGVFILVVVYVPAGRLGFGGSSFVLAGGLAGLLAPLVGATGPLIAPFFLGKGLSKEAIVGSKAACQTLTHVAKIVLFGVVLDFVFGDYLGLILWMGVGVVLGSYVGKRVLQRFVSERVFLVLYRGVLTVIAVKILVYDGGVFFGVFTGFF